MPCGGIAGLHFGDGYRKTLVLALVCDRAGLHLCLGLHGVLLFYCEVFHFYVGLRVCKSTRLHLRLGFHLKTSVAMSGSPPQADPQVTRHLTTEIGVIGAYFYDSRCIG